eukprot:CAMPEP_0115100248 /NCGR_PEP_ID=MMETSP0227-20121206/32427_1 /TAXON_ID=89957 /ORGANISM="Polarella glacialis, Strain CCMP 1383" /LENGTH=102 /DNA_ID=CAMNT_0002495579 /DNA_START=116 /DNA_END=421 /DNA_ORIENTATION=+
MEALLCNCQDLAVAPSDFRRPGYRGLAALHAIAPGDVLLRVPASKCLSAGSAREALGSCAKGLSDQDAFILHLVRERDNGEKGHLWPWFQSLPTTAATTTTT